MNSNQTKKKSFDFNYVITKFFLNNTRLTILSLVFFVIVGVFATTALKTTGFPNPEIGVSIIQTSYPGATAEVVNRDVTIPLEGAVKNIEGVKRFNSTSQNSFSNVVVEFDEEVDLDIVRNRLSTAITSVDLPDDVLTPRVSSPSIGGPDIILSITSPTLAETYDVTSQLITKLNSRETISEVSELNPLEKQVVVSVDNTLVGQRQLDINTIQSKLASFDETLPVVSNVSIDGVNKSITTSISGNSFEDIQALQIKNRSGESIPLIDVASVEVEYNFVNDNQSFYGLRSDEGKSVISPSTIIEIKAVDQTDQNELLESVEDDIKDIQGDILLHDRLSVIEDIDESKSNVTIAFTAAEDNNRQVAEVISGLIGGPIDELGALRYLGFALGGIWLVMFVMILIVSWRAAIIAALSIPLSFIFSTGFLFITGESLNTLTLFSLVLVTGLVVDPTLVVLEAIQRKLDAGHKAKEAVLEAIADVGMGVFLAMVTNIIVFAPFGVLSGVFGQIFRYIPFTIVPAVVGSYVIPIVVLSWLGSKFLKRNSHATGNEEENLWGISKGLIELNKRILNSHPSIRFTIIAVFLVIPIAVSGALFATGAVKSVQFAETEDAEFIQVSGSFLTSLPQEKQDEVEAEVLNDIVAVEEVETVLPLSNEFGYFIYLEDKKDRDRISGEIVDDLNELLIEKYGEEAEEGERSFFDIKVQEAQTGGQTDYQTSIALESENLEALKSGSIAVGELIKTRACVEDDTKIVLDEDCDEDDLLVDAVDDGFSFKDNTVLDIQLNREGLLNNSLAALGRGPLSFGVNQSLANQFTINRDEPVATIELDGEDVDVILEPNQSITTKNQIENQINNLGGPDTVVGEVVETKPAQSIRRQSGKTTALVNIRFKDEFANNQGFVGLLNEEVTEYYSKDDGKESIALGLEDGDISAFSDGQAADAATAFTQLGIALVLAIVLSYIVLAVFFNSFLQPLSILYTVPITFIGVFPALAFFVGGQFGFLEIIGLIILIGIVENVAIFLIDGANQKADEDGWDKKHAISYMSGIRFKPVLMTSVTTFASLLPLAIFSEFYRSISTVVLSGLLVSGFISLITTPILYIFFDWLSHKYRKAPIWNKILFFIFAPIYMLVWSLEKKNK